MEAIVTENTEVSEKDVDRVEKAIKADTLLIDVFPRLRTIGMAMEGEGTTFTVKFSKWDGAPVRFVGGDDLEGVAAIREVDLQAKFHMTRAKLAEILKLTMSKCLAVRWHWGIDGDPNCCHVFKFNKSEHPSFSDNAAKRIQEALPSSDIDDVWKIYQRRPR